MSGAMHSYQARNSVPVFALDGPVDSHTVTKLTERVSDAATNDASLVIIDLLATPTVAIQILADLCHALRGAADDTAVAVITSDPRLHDAFELGGTDRLTLHPTIKGALGSRPTDHIRSQ